MTDKYAFIGDIHADSVRLSSLLGKLDSRQLIFLGDYIDHGPNSRDVVEILVEIKTRKPTTVFLLGNHELGLLAFLSQKLSFLEYAWMGGLSTIRSYIGKARCDVHSEFVNSFPPRHYQFLSDCGPFFETAEFLACHAGVNPVSPDSRGLSDIVIGRHGSLFENGFRPSKLVICGHYLQATRKPFVGNGLICLNTGSGTSDGPLTALLYPEMTFLQT